MKTLFLYYDPNFAHAKMAKALHADFYDALKQIIENYSSIDLLGCIL